MPDSLQREFAVLCLQSMRIAGLILGMPFLFSYAPTRVRAAIVLIFTFVSYAPGVRLNTGWLALSLSVPTEFLIGFSIGFVVRIAISSLEFANETISHSIGLAGASLFDPHTQTSESGLSEIIRMVISLVALTIGMHRVVLASLIESFHLIPVGMAVAPGAPLEVFVRISTEALATGLRIAFPVVAVLAMVHLALALISRAAPQLQILSVGFAATLLGGLYVVSAAVPDMTIVFVEEFHRVGPRIESVLGAFAAR